MKIIFLTFILVFLVSCGKRSSLYFKDGEIRQEGVVTFAEVKANIFEAKCKSCHPGFVQDEKNLYKYINEDQPEESKLFIVVKNGSMPKRQAPLNSAELEMVRQYVHQVEVLRDVSFEELNAAILAPKCVSCHKRAVDEESIQKWINKEEPLKSKLLTSTESGRMPKGGDHLKKSEMSMIKGYVLKATRASVQ